MRSSDWSADVCSSDLYSAEPNDQHGHTTPGSSCTQRDHDLSAVTTFDVKSSLLLPGPDSNSATTTSTVLATQRRQYAQSIDRGLTDKVAPKALRERRRFVALQAIDEFRYVRAWDERRVGQESGRQLRSGWWTE